MATMPARRRTRQSWFVYLVRCRDGSLYTGVALDVDRRVAEHNAGRGGRYTRSRAPVRIVVASRALDKRAAYRLEWAIKQLRAREKPDALRAWQVPARAGPASDQETTMSSDSAPGGELRTMTYATTGRIARITLNRPERGNGITLDMPGELAALRRARQPRSGGARHRAVRQRQGLLRRLRPGRARRGQGRYRGERTCRLAARSRGHRGQPRPAAPAWDPMVDYAMMAATCAAS